MSKSELQTRAEAAASKFKQKARRPIVIEFAGVPKAGKTTTLNTIHGFLKRCGFRVETVIERASVSPIRDKKHFNFNVWTACTSLTQILEKTQDPPSQNDPEILILDRGIFDALSWMSMMEKMKRLRKQEREIIEKFLLIDDWRKRIAGVIVMKASAEDAMKRERGYLPVTGKGSIMNPEVIQQMTANTNMCMERFRNSFKLFDVDTSTSTGSTPQSTAEYVAKLVLSIIEDELDEEVLSIDRSKVQKYFESGVVIQADQASLLVRDFSDSGNYLSRDIVEKDLDRVQALPVVVIKNRSGKILQLKRKEKDTKNVLHEQLVIWAGGHVRKEDSANGSTLLNCAVRELQEELRLRVSPVDLKLMGAVYHQTRPGLIKHMAIVYEWQAESDEVDVVLNGEAFFERRGSSQSGQFVGITDLQACLDSDKVVEEWSVSIIKELMNGAEFMEPQTALFS